MDHRLERNPLAIHEVQLARAPNALHEVPFLNRHKESAMNRDQVKGRIKDVGGKIQLEAGKASGSISQQAKGLAKQVAGKVQKTVGDARNDAEKGRS